MHAKTITFTTCDVVASGNNYFARKACIRSNKNILQTVAEYNYLKVEVVHIDRMMFAAQCTISCMLAGIAVHN